MRGPVLLLLLLAGGQTAPAAPAAAPAESLAIVGEIVWVDVPARLVLIRESVKTTRVKDHPPTHRTVALSVAPDVTITRGTTAVTLDTLRPKDHVTARYVAAAGGAKALSFRVAEAAPRPRATAKAVGGPSPSGGY